MNVLAIGCHPDDVEIASLLNPLYPVLANL